MKEAPEAGEEHANYEVFFTDSVSDFIDRNIFSQRVFEKIDLYRELLAAVPDLGATYDPGYPATKPPFPCRRLPIPDTPFNLYYIKDDDAKTVTVFYVEHQGIDPESHFEWGIMSF